jgi:glycosyltransferase involved in cell wall biosynthesis
MNIPKISIVSPVYKAKTIIPELVDRIIKSVSGITENFEIILVDDNCPENSWESIRKVCERDQRVKGIKLSRNFGQHYAITAGLDNVKGEWIVVMDCDLQDLPEEIPNLFNKAQEGYDAVLAQRVIRKDSFAKRNFSRFFYKTLKSLSGIDHDESVANFGIYSRQLIDAVLKMREPIRFFPTMVHWVGFKQIKLPVQHESRTQGSSSYDYKKLFKLAMEIILSNSEKPLKFFVLLGFIISVLSIFVAVIYFIAWFTGKIHVVGFMSLIISIWMLSGLILSTLGVVGLYVGKTFESVKNRPIYLIQEKLND